MKTKLVVFVVALLTTVISGFAAEPAAKNARVVVNFDHPEKFTDLKDSWTGTERGRENYMALFREFLEKETPRYLAEGQVLTITFTDIDLAGDFEPERGANFSDVRIVKDLYPPRLTFSYKLTDASGAVLKEGNERLLDMSFQMSGGLFDRQDSLRYEKNMLRNWLRDQFPRAKKAPANS